MPVDVDICRYAHDLHPELAAALPFDQYVFVPLGIYGLDFGSGDFDCLLGVLFDAKGKALPHCK